MLLSYASRWGHALIDRRLYLLQAWAEDGARRAKAAIPATTMFATKPAIARDLIAFALDAGVPCSHSSTSCRLMASCGRGAGLGHGVRFPPDRSRTIPSSAACNPFH